MIAEEFNIRSLEYEKHSWWSVDPSIAGECVDLLRGLKLGNLLDAGGGTGALSRVIEAHCDVNSVALLDASEGMLGKAPERYAKHHLDLDALPHHFSLYDTICLRQVFQYLADPQQTLDALLRWTNLNATVYVGQIVAPTDSVASHLSAIAEIISPNRKRVFSVSSLTSMLVNQGRLRLKRIVVTPFRDSLSDWANRSDQGNQEAVLEKVGSLPASVLRTLDIDLSDPELRFSLNFYHSLWSVGEP